MNRLFIFFIFLTLCFSVGSFSMFKMTSSVRKESLTLTDEIEVKQNEINSFMRLPRMSLPTLDVSYRSLMSHLTMRYSLGLKIVSQGDTTLKSASKEWRYGVMTTSVKILHNASIKETLNLISDIERTFPVNMSSIKYTPQGYEVSLIVFGKFK